MEVNTMANFCKQCGAALNEGAKFCKECGKAVEVQVTPQQPAAQPAPTYTPPVQQKVQGAAQTAQKAASVVSQLTGGGTWNASASAGVMTLGGNSPINAIGAAGGAVSGALQALNPIKVLFSGATGVVKGIGAAFKDKKKWLPAIILAVTWICLTLLPMLGINPVPMQFISWLTFAQGGMRGGIGGAALGTATGFLGGVIGKGIFAGLITSFVTALIQRQNPLKSIGGGFGRMFSAFNFKQPGSIGPMLLGAGIALIGYNFMAGTASLTGTMAGIAALVMTLKSLGSRAGFLRNLLGGLLAKKKQIDTTAVNTCMAGMASGFAVSIPLSAIPWAYTPYAAGAVLFVAGIILAIALKNNKEVAAA